jgi:hypothetical protein
MIYEIESDHYHGKPKNLERQESTTKSLLKPKKRSNNPKHDRTITRSISRTVRRKLGE